VDRMQKRYRPSVREAVRTLR